MNRRVCGLRWHGNAARPPFRSPFELLANELTIREVPPLLGKHLSVRLVVTDEYERHIAIGGPLVHDTSELGA